MKKLTIEMPLVIHCDIGQCGYNVGKSCHAKAITVGNGKAPHCDTFLDSPKHSKEAKHIAGVGACKVGSCKYNQDFECMADNIMVGFSQKKEINCLTFEA